MATFQALWPEMPARVSSPAIDMLDYPNRDISMEDMLHIMVGDFQRILVYPQKGFHVEQQISDFVMTAYHYLLKEGYNHHLVQENV